MPAQSNLAPSATGRPPARLIRWNNWELLVAVLLVAAGWALAVWVPRLIRTTDATGSPAPVDPAARWFIESVIRNLFFVSVPLALLVFKHRQPVLGTLVPPDRVVTDFGWGLEIALAVGALNVLAVQRALPALQAMDAAGPSAGPAPYPWYYLGAYKIGSMRELVLFVFGWGLFPPIGEEIFFRGFLYAWLRRRMKAGYAIALSAFVFSLIHYPLGVHPLMLRVTHLEPMLATFILGLVVATVYEYSGSLLSPIMVHMGLNASFVLFTAMGGELARAVPSWILIAGAVVFAAHFFYSSRYLFRKAR
ncbi:MAG: lysostaphin resistance A-like protein [Planctomycetota bacterium]|jgi:membrane protease YdiL (CAAX protease family)